MSDIENHVVEMQTSESYRLGWRDASTGKPRPIYSRGFLHYTEYEKLQAGWDAFYAQGQSA